MAVALVDRRIGRQAVEIALALDVPDVDAFAARQHDIERLVVLGAKAASVAIKSLTGQLIFCHRAIVGRLPKLTNIMARVVSREPGGSALAVASMFFP